jgi:hypothetical protein
MSSKSQLLYQQLQWAESRGLAPDARGYLQTVEANLLRPLNESTKNAFENGSGSELHDTPSRPAKMKALHSSSALVVNIFDSWVGKDTSALHAALGLGSEIAAIKFEEQYPTGLTGTPPNLDVALELADGNIVGIESKFSEWLTPKSKSNVPFKPKYFPEARALWKERSFPRAQQLADAINNGTQHFRYLDAPQLLKHTLGMATQLGARFALFYIYFDWPGMESDAHSQEIQRFGALVDDGLGFKAMSYQDLFSSLNKNGKLDESYRNYLCTRYFGNVK